MNIRVRAVRHERGSTSVYFLHYTWRCQPKFEGDQAVAGRVWAGTIDEDGVVEWIVA